jgi:hypothetical protein
MEAGLPWLFLFEAFAGKKGQIHRVCPCCLDPVSKKGILFSRESLVLTDNHADR